MKDNNETKQRFMMKFSKLLLILLLLIVVLVPIASFAVAEGYTVIKKDVVSVDAILVQMRLIDLNYLAYRPTGKFGNISVYAMKQFELNNDLEADGQVNPTEFDALFENGLARSKTKSDIVIYGDSDDTITHLGDGISWTVVNAAFPVGTTAVVQDCHTNITFNIKRVGGEGHAHVEPVTQRDTNNFINMFTKDDTEVEYLKAGRLTYEKRPCVVTIGDNSYAASLFGYVHGDDPGVAVDPENPDAVPEEDNGMNGYLCLFFADSTTDVLNMSDPEHDANVAAASH